MYAANIVGKFVLKVVEVALVSIVARELVKIYDEKIKKES